MTEQLAHDVLRRMATPPPPAPDDVPITSSKAVRLAIKRAADKTHNMVLSVSSLQEEVITLDGMLGALDEDLMLLAMVADGLIQGLAAVSLELRGALLELQTVGKVLEHGAEPRKPTETDARLSEPLINAFISHLLITGARTPLDGWCNGFAVGEKLASARAAGLILDDIDYRVVRVSLDLGVADRTAELTIALPNRSKLEAKVVKPEVTGDWASRFQTVVNASPARLDALLHRFSMPLHRAENLAVGQVIPLPGCTVSSVKLIALDGRRVATGRLGQSGGMRAVRVEAAPHIQMSDMDNLGGVGSIDGLPDMGGMPMGDEMRFAAEDPAAIEMPAMAPIEEASVASEAEAAEDAAPLSWDDEVPTAEPAALSWDDEDMEGSDTTAEAAPLDWSNEEFEPPP